MDIRARIAEILADRTIVAYNQYGDDYISDLSAKMLADDLVSELGLKQEWSDDLAGPEWCRYSRWVTETTSHPGPKRLAAGLT